MRILEFLFAGILGAGVFWLIDFCITRKNKTNKIEGSIKLVKDEMEKNLYIINLILNSCDQYIKNLLENFSSHGFDLTFTNSILSEGLNTEVEINRIKACREIKIVLENIQVRQDEILKNVKHSIVDVFDYQNMLSNLSHECKKAQRQIESYLKESWDDFYFAQKNHSPSKKSL